MENEPLVYEYNVGRRKPYDYDYGNKQSHVSRGCPFFGP